MRPPRRPGPDTSPDTSPETGGAGGMGLDERSQHLRSLRRGAAAGAVARRLQGQARRGRLLVDGEPLRPGHIVAPPLGWAGDGAGRHPWVETGATYMGTSIEVAGLYPFVQGGGLPPTGVPIGLDTFTRETVCLDPARNVGTLTTNPGIWIEAQPGVGKSALIKRIVTVLTALGYMPVIPGDHKGEYTGLARELGMQVITVGRGLDRINPLDSGPVGRELARLGSAARVEGSEGARLLEEVTARRQELLNALLVTKAGMGRPLTSSERLAIDRTVRVISERAVGGQDPTVPELVEAMKHPSSDLIAALMEDDAEAATRSMRELIHGLENLCAGPLSGMFDGPSTKDLDPNAVGVTVDLSAIRRASMPVQAAAMLATWSYTFGSINAAQALGLVDKPLVTPFDEFWKPMSAAEGLVDSFNELSRLNRVEGVVTIMSTHTLMDLESLPNPHDVKKAMGLMERCDTAIFGACSPKELERISEQRHLTSEERALISGWSAPAAAGRRDHPARGKFLIKIGQGTRLGVPVQMILTPEERELYETDRKDRAL